jgi:long-chain fatty acid transport protein
MKRFTIVLMVFLLTSISHATHGTRLVGFSALTIGRAGTTFGLFDSPSLMMTNPAGISFFEKSAVDATFSLMIPELHFTNSLNNADGKTNYFPLPSLAYVHADEERQITWGFGLFTQGGMGADFTLNHPLFGAVQQEYHSKLAVMQGGPSIAFKLSPNFSVGVSAQVVYSQMEFKMPYSLSPSTMKGVIDPNTGMTFGNLFAASPSQGGFGYSEVTAAADMSSLTAFGFAGKIGLAYRINEQFTVGLSYTSPSSLTYKNGKATMDMTAQMNDAFGKAVQGYTAQNPGSTQQQAQAAVMQQFAGMGIDLSKGAIASYNLESKLTLPQSIGLGASMNATTKLRLVADVEWVNWKNAFDKMHLSLSDGNNSNINRMLGNNGDLSIDFPMDWNNEICFRLGGEYDINPGFTVRAGYAYGNNPIPGETVFPVFPAIVDNHITLGASYRISSPLTIHAAYELALNKKQMASDQSLIAQEYDNSTSELTEHIFHLSLSWSFE